MLLHSCYRRYALIYAVLVLLLHTNILEARDIYVKLSGASSFSIESTAGNLSMVDAEGRIANLGESVNISVSDGNARISSYYFPLPIRITNNGLLKFKDRTYRGSFLITQKAGLLNAVDVEYYLCGVLPAEVGATWPDEALRAQAITARTYVLRQSLNRGKKGYDVVDSDADQVYRGAGIETDKTNRAVASTMGEILTYGKEIAQTFFHSDSGGHTADIADVWGQSIPYLRGVPEVVTYKSPVSTWKANISASKIQAAITKITGTDIGAISMIQVAEVDDGGRAVTMTFTGANGTKTVKASQFRTATDPRTLKSTMLTPSGGAFRIPDTPAQKGKDGQKLDKPASPYDLTFEEEQGIASMTAEGIFTTTELIDMRTNPAKRKQYYQAGLTRTKQTIKTSQPEPQKKQRRRNGFMIEKSGNDFVFYGRGWGHGVGMCQWGAMGMAEKGYTAEKILMHYYPGTVIKKFR